MTFLSDLKYAVRSLGRTKGLAITVILTLALGIGANAAIFGVVRGVLLRPLVNRDEQSLIYIRQTARGDGGGDARFSIPEITDIISGVKTLNAFGDFSTIGFTMIGLGEPREVQSGVVSGSYFEVMGLRPVLGRLLDKRDDGPNAAGACVLTYRFWTGLKSDPSVLGKTIRLGSRPANIVGVVEPSVPYPADTEIIANVVTSPHHLSATMVQGRVHRMTDLFARLAPGYTLEQARAELNVVHGAMLKAHPEAYSKKADYHIEAMRLRDQITSGARTVLLVLMAASGLVFIIACSNVANLILARSVRREGELAIRAALGANSAALRRTLLAESLLLCAAGAGVGLVIAAPMIKVMARYAARFSVRALDITVDPSMLWVSIALALISAVLLAYVPRLPSADSSNGLARSSATTRITGGANRRLRSFAVVQIAASFVLLAGAGMFLKTLMSLQAVRPGFDTHNVLVLNVPTVSYERTPEQMLNFHKEVLRRVAELPGVEHVATGTMTPWRDAGTFGFGFEFSAEGHVTAPGEENPKARFRTASPGYFASLGVRIIAGRDFDESDRMGGERVVIVSQSLAQRLFPNQEAVNRHVSYVDPVMKFIGVSDAPRRIVGIAADVDDERIIPGPAITIYNPYTQELFGSDRLFVRTRMDPYALVTPITRIIRTLAPDQPVEKAATIADVRAEMLTPDRLNTLVFGIFAGVALAIAVVGVAGVLAFSVSGRTREFGIKLAVGAQPGRLLTGVLGEGALIACFGVVAGIACGVGLAQVAGSFFGQVEWPSALTLALASAVLLAAAVVASVIPAARAARVDVTQALRAE